MAGPGPSPPGTAQAAREGLVGTEADLAGELHRGSQPRTSAGVGLWPTISVGARPGRWLCAGTLHLP